MPKSKCEAIALRFDEPAVGSKTLVRASVLLGTACDIGYYERTEEDDTTAKIYLGVYSPPPPCIQVVPPLPFQVSVLVNSSTNIIDKVEIYIGDDLTCKAHVSSDKKQLLKSGS